MNFLPCFGVENSLLNLLKHFRYTLYPGRTTVPYFESIYFYNLPKVTNPFLHLAQCFSISFGYRTLSHSKNLRSTKKFLYRVSQEECKKLRESVPYVKIYRYNPKHLYPKLNSYGDNGQRSLKL
jgi:hypothetical protein